MPSPFPNLPPEQRGRLHVLRHRSRALEGNPWGDPADRDVLVYTPPGHEAQGRPLPALLVLAAFSGTGEKLLARSLTRPSIATRFDRLIRDGCPPFVAVLPDCMTSLGGSQYVDSPALGAYASYVVDELRPFVEERFALTGRWGAFGHSSGGFGALHLAMRHPGALQAVASHAGDVGFDLCYLGDIGKALAGLDRLGGLERFVQRFWELEDPPGAAFAALNVLCMSAAYTPAPGAEPFPARLPFDPETGEVRFDVLRDWRRFDPLVEIEQPDRAAALRALDLLYLDCGRFDEYNLQYGARRLVRRLDTLGVPHRYEEFDGGHRGTHHRFDTSVPLLVEALSNPSW